MPEKLQRFKNKFRSFKSELKIQVPLKIQRLYQKITGKPGTMHRKIVKITAFALLPTALGVAIIRYNPEVQMIASATLSRAKYHFSSVNSSILKSSTESELNENKKDFDLTETVVLLVSGIIVAIVFVTQLQEGFDNTPPQVPSESLDDKSFDVKKLIAIIDRYYRKLHPVLGQLLVAVVGTFSITSSINGLAADITNNGPITTAVTFLANCLGF